MSTDVLMQNNDTIRLYNGSGAAWAQGDFVVVGSLCGRVAEPDGVANTAWGAVEVADRLIIRTTDLKTSEDTFATANGVVYFDTATEEFSDTETDGYYAVGQLRAAKGTNDYIEFIKFGQAELVVT